MTFNFIMRQFHLKAHNFTFLSVNSRIIKIPIKHFFIFYLIRAAQTLNKSIVLHSVETFNKEEIEQWKAD